MNDNMKKLKVCVLILNCNNPAMLKECIASYKRSSLKDVGIIVIDNASTDKSLEIARQIKGVEICQNKENLGYCGGFNAGIKYALKKYSPRYFVVSNPDLIVDKEALEAIYNGMENDKSIGFGGARQLDYDTGKVQSYGARWKKATAQFSPNMEIVTDDKIGYIEGTFIMVRADMLKKKGLWDERYFIYHEDIEIQWRYKKLGYSSKIFDNAIIRHRSHWTGQRKPFQFYYMFRNRLVFIRENSNGFVFLYSLGIFMTTYLYYFIFDRPLSKAIFGGISDYFKRRFGKNPKASYS